MKEILTNFLGGLLATLCFVIFGWLFKRARWFEQPGLAGDWILEEWYLEATPESNVQLDRWYAYDVRIQSESKHVEIARNAAAHADIITLNLVDDSFAISKTIAFETPRGDSQSWKAEGRCFRFKEIHQNEFQGEFFCPGGNGRGKCRLLRVTDVVPNRPLTHFTAWLFQFIAALAIVLSCWWVANPKILPGLVPSPTWTWVLAVEMVVIILALSMIALLELVKRLWSGPPLSVFRRFGNHLLHEWKTTWRRTHPKRKSAILRILSEPARYEKSESHFGYRAAREKEVKWVAEFDQKEYGADCVSFPQLRCWWKRYPAGIRISYHPRTSGGPNTKEEMCSFVGLWPITQKTYQAIVAGRVTEDEIGGPDGENIVHDKSASVQYWYLADILLCRKGDHTAARSLPMLILNTYRSWLKEMPKAVLIHMCAVGSSAAGKKFLQELGFTSNGAQLPKAAVPLPIFELHLELAPGKRPVISHQQ